jgi:hypothetical protein
MIKNKLMIKKDLQKCKEKEVLICKRLFNKIPADMFECRLKADIS